MTEVTNLDVITNDSIKEYYIAYFDILGYKNFFEQHSDKVTDFLSIVNDAFKGTIAHMYSLNQSGELLTNSNVDIKVKVFSDNILLCLERGNSYNEPIRCLCFLSAIADIQKKFIIKYGLFIRGGITIGNLYISEIFVFGQGLIDVVEMEEQAIYPRIIISNSVNDFIFSWHYLSNDDFLHREDIEKRVKLELDISNEDIRLIEKFDQLLPLETYIRKWVISLVVCDADNKNVLNYFYNYKMQGSISPQMHNDLIVVLKEQYKDDFDKIVLDDYSYEETVKIHKEKVIEKLYEFGHYNDIETGNEKLAIQRESILKKYMWVAAFHNFVFELKQDSEFFICFYANCDRRFMRITITVENEDTKFNNNDQN